MAKKINHVFRATAKKNLEQGGSWLIEVQDFTAGATPDSLTETFSSVSAWANASAAKRSIKADLLKLTGRKSCKFEVLAMDEKERPVHITAELHYRVDA
jgi:hypothetical protein